MATATKKKPSRKAKSKASAKRKPTTKPSAANKTTRADRPEFQIAQSATEIITLGGKANLGSRVSSTQAQKVRDAKLPNPKQLPTAGLKRYATTDDKLGDDQKAKLMEVVDKIGDRYVWPRKTAAVIVAIREHSSR